MKFIVMRYRTIQERVFFEVEGETYCDAQFEPGKHVKTVITMDTMTATGPIKEADQVDDDWYRWVSE